VVDDGTTVELVNESWENIKQAERDSKLQRGVLADVPVALPALPRAQKLQKRAARHNFDWRSSDAVLGKLQEEIAELRQAMRADSGAEIAQEMGDVLFSCVNLSRHLGLDAETSLRHASDKFERRFRNMEAAAEQAGVEFSTLTDSEMDALWEAAKLSLR
jgi:ATP diphosphatase